MGEGIITTVHVHSCFLYHQMSHCGFLPVYTETFSQRRPSVELFSNEKIRHLSRHLVLCYLEVTVTGL